ncbi:DUF4893 domain-containing protein [Pseudomonas aeruginosa]|uniref:DUF4893 domain-containing protein n=1 Tax=Pseudomonas aeruginosa TaxID=287 RepID=UPI00177E7426|nr:DUF4893 domain-containing protein [Pseudomonas aeruginosa]
MRWRVSPRWRNSASGSAGRSSETAARRGGARIPGAAALCSAATACRRRNYDSAFEEFLPELEQLELSLAQPVVAVDEKGLLGDWKCRSTQADQYGIYRYPNFQCRIRRTDRGLFLEKTSGSQRVSGYLFREGTQRYVFLGGATVNDEPQVAFSGLAHGAPAESDVVALLRPHAGGFLLLFPERRGGYEVLEFSR